jgi:hypothetical protein
VKRRIVALATSLLLLNLVAGPAWATSEVLDQSNNWAPGYDVGGPASLAQTFTAGKTGTLTSVELYLVGTGTVYAELDGATNGLLGYSSVIPIAPALATAHATASASGSWVKFTFSAPANVVTGNYYAIAFSPTASNGTMGSLNTYSGGRALIYHSSAWVAVDSVYPGAAADFGFRTFVEVAAVAPKPTPKPTAAVAPKATPKPTAAVAAVPTVVPTATQGDTPAPTDTSTTGATSDSPVAAVAGVTADAASLGAAGNSAPTSDAGTVGSMPAIVAAILAVLVVLGGILFLVMRRRGAQKAA